MLTPMLTALLIAPIQAPTVTRADPKARPAEVAAQPFADAEPDVVLRGRTIKLVVKGRDLASLRTLQVNPPDGVTLRSITPLPPRADGSAAVSVEMVVDATATPGERTLVLTTAAVIYTASGRRPGADSVAQAMDSMLAAVTRDRSSAEAAGVLYINSHEITIAGVDVGKGNPRDVRITAIDTAGDVESSKAAGTPAAPAAGITLLPASSELILSEARCGRDIYDSVLDDAMVREERIGSVLLVASLSALTLEGAGVCTLRVRVRDKAGNTSAWFATPLERR